MEAELKTIFGGDHLIQGMRITMYNILEYLDCKLFAWCHKQTHHIQQQNISP
jgi:hypothetical protein